MNEEFPVNRTQRRRRRRRRRILPLLAAVLLFLALLALVIVVARSLRAKPEPPPVDPHAGQVYVNNGANMVWLTPVDGVADAAFYTRFYGDSE